MIREISENAAPNNRKAHIISASCFIAAALLFVTRFIVKSHRGIIDLFTMALIIAAVFIYTRYVVPRYTYEIMISSEGEPLFIVSRMTGKRGTTLCRIALADILSIRRENREELKAHKTEKKNVKYLYTPSLFPEKVHRIRMRNAYETAEIVIECSDEFGETLTAAAAEARALARENEEY